MVADKTVQGLCDVVGLIVDRTVSPELVLGQACLVSKSRAVSCASTVFNYNESPWALAVRFPHPDLIFAVKAIHLHPDFDKRDARLHYLAQTGCASDLPLVQDNDLATLTLDPELPDMSADRLAELNSVLSLPLNVSSQDLSGSMSGNDIAATLQNIFSTGQGGLLTLFDTRNHPLARISIRQGIPQKIIYKGLMGELALFELMYRRPDGGFVFTGLDGFAWPNMRDVTTRIDTLIAEGQRRAQELSATLGYLGGPEARFERVSQQYDPASISPAVQWVAERLWSSLDGYLTIDKLWERVGADTYTIAYALQELLKLQVISPVHGSPFTSSGQLGSPMTATLDVDANVWEQLSGFYLDPLSGRPIIQPGNFFGISRVLQPKSLLHTIVLPPHASGALILREDKLIGIHTGAYSLKPGQPAPPVRLQQMTWIGALQDLGAKRLKGLDSTLSLSAEEAVPAPIRAQAASKASPPLTASRLARFRGSEYDEDLEEPQQDTEGITLFGVIALPEWVEKKHLIMAGAAMVLLLGAILMLWPKGHAPAPAAAPAVVAAPAAKSEPNKSVKTALELAGFKDSPPETFVFEDTSAKTGQQLSFGLNSEAKNQRILFLVWDNTSPVDQLDLITTKPPYSDLSAPKPSEIKVDQGQSDLGGGKFNWFVGRYEAGDKKQMALIGAYRSPKPGKAIVVVATPFTDSDKLDYQTTLWLVDTMAAPYSKSAAAKKAQENQAEFPGAAEEPKSKPLASAAELEDYTKKVEALIKLKFSPPKDAKAKLGISFVIDEQGKVSKLEISEPSGEEASDQLVLKAITGSQPYPAPPHTQENSIKLKATADGGKLEVKQQ